MTFNRASLQDGNLCVIWIDDMSDIFTWRDAFGVRLHTPHIDRLMAEGVRFANAYATVPLCAPCRAEVATGLSPFRSGLVDLNRFWRDALPPTASWVFDLRRAGSGPLPVARPTRITARCQMITSASCFTRMPRPPTGAAGAG
jgi:Sulfatase